MTLTKVRQLTNNLEVLLSKVKEGKKSYFRAYYQAHKEQIKEQSRAYYQAHKEEIKEQKRAYRQVHPDITKTKKFKLMKELGLI